ncbi:hypothetical protein RJ55_02793 [Drechmeria coniospora]|nr:hypothetical protein RJ55_02793 [Drechmeria coniospora]
MQSQNSHRGGVSACASIYPCSFRAEVLACRVRGRRTASFSPPACLRVGGFDAQHPRIVALALQGSPRATKSRRDVSVPSLPAGVDTLSAKRQHLLAVAISACPITMPRPGRANAVDTSDATWYPSLGRGLLRRNLVARQRMMGKPASPCRMDHIQHVSMVPVRVDEHTVSQLPAAPPPFAPPMLVISTRQLLFWPAALQQQQQIHGHVLLRPLDLPSPIRHLSSVASLLLGEGCPVVGCVDRSGNGAVAEPPSGLAETPSHHQPSSRYSLLITPTLRATAPFSTPLEDRQRPVRNCTSSGGPGSAHALVRTNERNNGGQRVGISRRRRPSSPKGRLQVVARQKQNVPADCSVRPAILLGQPDRPQARSTRPSVLHGGSDIDKDMTLGVDPGRLAVVDGVEDAPSWKSAIQTMVSTGWGPLGRNRIDSYAILDKYLDAADGMYEGPYTYTCRPLCITLYMCRCVHAGSCLLARLDFLAHLHVLQLRTTGTKALSKLTTE